MTVEQLIKQLQKLPGNLPVVIQIDPEGNGYEYIRGSVHGLAEEYLDTVYDLDVKHEDTMLYDAPLDEWEAHKETLKEVALIYP